MKIGTSQAWLYNNKNKFTEWWDADKFNWFKCSEFLPQYFSEHFDLWWDADRFKKLNYWGVESLIDNCPKHLDKWWDDSYYEKVSLEMLAENCMDSFDVWFDPDKFSNAEIIESAEVCKHLNIDLADFIQSKLKALIKKSPKKKKLEYTLKWIK